MNSARITVALVGLLVTLLALAGCSADNLLSANSISADASVAGVAYPDNVAKAESKAFTPFGDPLEKEPGARVVIAQPTRDEIMAVGPLPEMAWGRADAPVTVIQYASLTCPHCKAFHRDVFPEFKRRYVDTGKVRFIMREFPIGKTSGAATVALRCAPPEKYLDLYGKFMARQAEWVSMETKLDAIYKVASDVGMTRATFDACRENQAMIDGLKWVKDRGRTLGIIGTPNFFIDNKLVKRELSMVELAGMIDPVIAGRPAVPVATNDSPVR